MSTTTTHRRRERTVTRSEHEALKRRLADVEDVLHMRDIEATTKPADYLAADLVKRMIAGEHPVRIWREHRGLGLNALAKKAKMPPSYLSEIESRKKPGSVAAYALLAAALGVSLDDLVSGHADK